MFKNDADFAVIGMACRFPGAKNYNQFWQNLIQGKNSITQIPKDRWDWQEYYGDPRTATNKTNIKWGGFIEDIDKFDPLFFNISPKEAACIDPQHRLFLQTAWHAIEDAGYSVESLSGKKIGIYAGVSKNDYSELMRESRQDIAPFISTGTVHSILVNRLSFLFDFHGRSEAVDTACSSSLVALHNAMRDISNGECEAALVGGVNALLAPTMFISHSKSGMLSIDGQCKTFDADANGYVRGEGVGVLLIKPLDKAIEAGDHIHGVIKSSAVNHGGRANFLTSPTVEAQADVINSALGRADINPATISYIEAHGTGTPLGDPIEVNALKKAFKSQHGKYQKALKENTSYCALSSVKTNIGHLESASGIAGIVKALLAMQHEVIPALQNFEKLNSYIDLNRSPFYVADKNIKWKALQYADGDIVPRRVGVSSFGMGGVNAHVVLEEAPSQKRCTFKNSDKIPQLVLVSSKSKKGLKNHAENLRDHLLKLNNDDDPNSPRLEDIAYTLQIGREQFGERLALIAATKAELIHKLTDYTEGKEKIQGCFTGSVVVKKGEKPELIKAIRERYIALLAEQWVHGAKLDWTEYYSTGNRPMKIPLPTYAFVNKRCWFSQDDVSSSSMEDKQWSLSAGQDKTLTMSETVFRKVLHTNDCFIQDHVVQGEKLLPGVACLEIARATYCKIVGHQPINAILDIFWISPVGVKDKDVSIDIKLTPCQIRQSNEQCLTSFQILLNGTLCSKGELGRSTLSETDSAAINISAIKEKCRQEIQQQELYQLFARNGLNYGPSFQALRQCVYSDRSIFSELNIPDTVRETFEDYVLHPSVMDGVFQTIVALSLLGPNRRDRQYVPFYLERVDIIKSIPPHCFAYATIRGEGNADRDEIKFDAVICDAEGNPLVKVTGLTKRAITLKAAEKSQQKEDGKNYLEIAGKYQPELFYRPVWQEQLVQEASEGLRQLIVFGNSKEIDQQLKQSPDFKGSVLLILRGDRFAVINKNHIEINSQDIDDYFKLIQYLKDEAIPINNILYLWNFSVTNAASMDSTDGGLVNILRLTKAIIARKAYKNLKLLYFYSLEEEYMEPYHSMVAGFARTLVYENPSMRYLTVGIDKVNAPELISLALKEFNCQSKSKLHEIAYRKGARLERKIIEFNNHTELNDDTPTLIRKGGVYLISGGAGGLGFIFAKYMSDKHAATVLLLGRSKLNSEIIQKIETIESYGGRCQYFSADITKQDELEKVISEIKNTHKRINGVIHAAGIIDDAYILTKKESSFTKVVATKVTGLVNLDSLTSSEKLDFFVMFSSIASLMPNQGQSDYAAANSYLDRYAALRNSLQQNHERSGVTLAINWPLWAKGGMRVTAEEEAHLLKEFGMRPLEEDKGIIIFEQGLSLAERYSQSDSLCQLVAIDGDKEKIGDCLGIDDSQINGLEVGTIVDLRDQEHVMEGVDRHKIESEVRRIFSDQFNVVADQIDGASNISEFGLDSASMLLIIQHINKLFEIDLKPTVFFEINTIDKFIQHVYETCAVQIETAWVRHNNSLIDVKNSNLSNMQFQRRFSTTEFYLRDHVVEGQYNMPGACYIEMARQAGDLLFGDKAVIKLVNNYWVSQLSSPGEDFSAYLNIIPKDSSYEYEIVSYTENQQKTIHAVGNILCGINKDHTSDGTYFDINAFRSRCSSTQTPDEIYKQIIAEGLHVGYTFKPMQEIFLNNTEALATLTLPEGIRDTLEDYVLHPTMLTGAFQTALISNRFDDNDNNEIHYIPISIDELEIIAPVTNTCFIYSKAHKKKTNLRKFDLVVCRQDGLIAVKLKGFSIRALKNEKTLGNGKASNRELVVTHENLRSTELVQATRRYIKILLSEPIGLSVGEIDESEPFEAYGINSVMIVELNKAFEDVFGSLSKTLFFEYRNIEELAQYFIENHADKLGQISGVSNEVVCEMQSDSLTDLPGLGDTTSMIPSLSIHDPLEGGDVSSTRLVNATHRYIKGLLSESIGLSVSEIDESEPFEAYGINSVMIVELNKSFEDVFGSLSKTLFFEYRNIEELAQYFIQTHADKLHHIIGVGDDPLQEGRAYSSTEFTADSVTDPPGTSETYLTGGSDDTLLESVQNRSSYKDNDIAIIGVEGQYPGASNLDQFWEVLKQGRDCVTDVPDKRFDFSEYFDADPEENKIYSKQGGFIDDVDKFDAAFFNITPREAELIDPQERLFLQVAWGTLEDAGYTPKTLLASSDRQVGVFVGALWQPYQAIGTEETVKGNIVAPSGLLYSIPNRVSYYLNLAGPSLAIDTACSSSLTAVHMACQSINSGDCKLAIAGGVNVSLHTSKYLFLSQNRFLSTDGRCRSFGDGGDGYVPGEGVGAILLKPLSEAIKDGDRIYAVIKGSSINHGGKTHGYTVPCPNAQASMIKAVHDKAGIDPRTISYVEAHGTGTPLGDPIEITGLTKAFESSTRDKQFCAIGSVKSNIGHLEAAAGIASITKVILQMKYNQLVPSIHADTLNPNIDFGESPFEVQRELADWHRPTMDMNGVTKPYARRAGISSFGAGGANAHILLEQYENEFEGDTLTAEAGAPVLIVLSAKNEDRLGEVARNLHSYLTQNPRPGSLNNIAYTLQVGREPMNERLGLIAHSMEEVREKLKAFLNKDKNIEDLYCGNVEANKDAFAVFGGDEDMIRIIDVWINKAKYNKLLDIWVKGFSIDWNTLYGKHNPQRIGLPTYPFAKERYWIPQDGRQKTEDCLVNRSVLHPLVHENISSLSHQRYSSTFTGHEYFLEDHVVGENKVLPAVAYIEMFRAASSLSSDQYYPCKLYNLTWLKPITVQDKSVKITVELSLEDDEIYLQASRESNGEYGVHAQGQLLYLDPQEEAKRSEIEKKVELEEIEHGLECEVRSEKAYRLFHNKGLKLQQGLQGINWIKWNDNKALGRIALPSSLKKTDRDAYYIHPCLLDSALQTALYVLESDHKKAGALYLPFSIEEVEFFAPLPDSIYSSVTPCDDKSMSDSHHPVRSFDVTLLDNEGKILVKVKNITFRETIVSDGNIRSLKQPKDESTLSYTYPTWVEDTIVASKLDKLNGTGIVIVSNNEEMLESFSDKLTRVKGEIPLVEVVLVNAYPKPKPGKIYINSIDEDDYHQFLDYLNNTQTELSHIVYLWDSSLVDNSTPVDESRYAITPLFYFDKLLLPSTKSIKQLFVNLIEKGSTKWVLEGAITGFLKSISAEYPKVTNKVISMETKQKGQNSWTQNIVDELRSSEQTENTWIRYKEKGTERLKWQLQPVDEIETYALTQLDNSLLKEGGTYLISGGMGGLGKVIGSYLVKNYHVNLILLGRSTLDKQGEAYLENLRSTGARAAYLQGNISDLEYLEQQITEVKNSYGSINGVIHSAGVLEDNLLTNKKLDSLLRVVEPKLQGTYNLDQVTRSEPLDFFVVFSSLTSILGNPGQSDYGAANGFMDAFIAYRETLVGREERTGLSLAINWPLWSEGQMGQDSDVLTILDESFGMPLDTAEGLMSFEQMLHLGRSQIAVVKKENKVTNRAAVAESKMGDIQANLEQARTQTSRTWIGSNLYEDIKSIIDELGKFSSDQVLPQSDFIGLGMDSVVLAKMASKLNKQYSLKISPAIFFEHTNLEKLNAHLIDEHYLEMAAYYESKQQLEGKNKSTKEIVLNGTEDSLFRHRENKYKPTAKAETWRKIRLAGDGVKKQRTKKDRDESSPAIAVIGMDCLFPGASDLESFWQLLLNRESAVSEVPADRWDWREYYGDPSIKSNKTDIKWGYFVDDLDKFDASFFNISPREASLMDPQQRILLQSVWKAVENAGYAPLDLSSNHNVGFFVGASTNDYYELLANSDIEAYSTTGGVHSITANRVSYNYDFKGPSISIDTACSSSLIALDMAVHSLEEGRCDVAVTGGVNALITPTLYISFSKAGMLSPDGNISPLDKRANGYVRGEGVGTLVLKRLDKAVEDNDVIHAVIKGTSVNHGGKVSSLTVPNPKAQSELVLDACKKADVDVSTLNYIEMHGTGTPLGDPIEINGLKTAFKKGNAINRKNYCGIASVKANIGHLEAAAGVAGVIKTILSLKNKKLPAQCNFEELNPHIQLEDTPFRVLRVNEEWEGLKDSAGNVLPRRAGVSSFGFGGANSHVVIEEYVENGFEVQHTKLGEQHDEDKPYLIVLSAKTEERLKLIASDLYDYLTNNGKGADDLIRIAYTLQVGREAMNERLGLLVNTMEELQQKLKDFLSDDEHIDNLYCGQVKRNKGALGVLTDDEYMVDVVDECISKRKYIKLIDHWVKGLSVDWEKLYGVNKPRRISLPTYPFAKERYWLSEDLKQKTEEPVVTRTALQPITGTLTAFSRPSTERYSTTELSPESLRNKGIIYFKKLAALILGMSIDKLDSTRSLEEYGMDSILVMQLINALRSAFPDINSTILLEYRTIDALVEHLIETQRELLIQALGYEGNGFDESVPLSESALAVLTQNSEKPRRLSSHHKALPEHEKTPISISQIASEVSNKAVSFKEALRMVKRSKIEAQ